MHHTRRAVALLLVTVAILSASAVFGAEPLRITIGVAGKDTINRNIYGHFSEHLGRCIYGGFYVGETNTRVPNTHGMRNDVVQALRKLHGIRCTCHLTYAPCASCGTSSY